MFRKMHLIMQLLQTKYFNLNRDHLKLLFRIAGQIGKR